MDTKSKYIINFNKIKESERKIIGSKVYNLFILKENGYRIPESFCLTTRAYDRFIKFNNLDKLIAFELNRKPLVDMRWEEIWDAANRIKLAFLKSTIPEDLKKELYFALNTMGAKDNLAVRSSGIAEDSATTSFAGIHESIINISSKEAFLEAIKVVWASLWSDSALLYRKELGLDPYKSKIALLSQKMIYEDYSGIAFSIDPITLDKNITIIEAVSGLCKNLVDGTKEPYKWYIDKQQKKIIKTVYPQDFTKPIIKDKNIIDLSNTIDEIENLFSVPIDVEWTGLGKNLTLLQARPVTMTVNDDDEERQWYLNLKPSHTKLLLLADRVENTLIPKLINDGENLASESLTHLNRNQLISVINHRKNLYEKWQKIYWDEFIPFAHGVRHLGDYYNTLIKPQDPYEFIKLLNNQPMISIARNNLMKKLAKLIANNQGLKNILQNITKTGELITLDQLKKALNNEKTYQEFMIILQDLLQNYLNITYNNEVLNNRVDMILLNLLELSEMPMKESEIKEEDLYERKFLEAHTLEHLKEGKEILRIGRISWKLRDDDNILVEKIKYELLRALTTALEYLHSSKQAKEIFPLTVTDTESILTSLSDTSITIEEKVRQKTETSIINLANEQIKARQLIGQPASSGIATGKAHIIKTVDDIVSFKANTILICDAIQPQMTHIMPLASAIVERRGGMLIHSTIIARELGIPCVNGIKNVTKFIRNDDIVTVDGYLGIVTIGEPEFDIELKP